MYWQGLWFSAPRSHIADVGFFLAVVDGIVALAASRTRWSRRSFGQEELECSKHGKRLKVSEPLSVIVMTYPYINDPKYWWERGEEARSIAKLLDDKEAKRQILAIAASYDRLSDHMKQRLKKLKK
jgi:hypothetical protein